MAPRRNNLFSYDNLGITTWLKPDHMAPHKNHRASDYLQPLTYPT